jgi:outer membrane protein
MEGRRIRRSFLMRLLYSVVTIAGFALGGFVTAAHAADVVTDVEIPAQAEATTETGLQYTFGLGVAYAPDYEGSDDYQAVPLWNLRVGNLSHPDTFIQILGPILRSNLVSDPHWRFGISGRYQPDYDNVEDSRVQDLKSTDAAGLLGVTIGYDFLAERGNDLAIELDAQFDVLHGNGGILTPRLRWRAPLSQSFVVGAAVSGTWGSEDYMGNRFGINADEAARSGLDRYDADSGFKNVAVNGTATYRFSQTWSVTGLVGYSHLLSQASDSPIVDDRGDENQFLGGILVNLSF